MTEPLQKHIKSTKKTLAELLVEFAVILIAPIIHTYYLWKYKKAEKKELFRKIKVFAVLYVLLELAVLEFILK